MLVSGGKFESDFNDSAYKVDMVLHIRSVGPADFGSYKCVAKNSLGETDGTIKLYSKFYHLQFTLVKFISIDLHTILHCKLSPNIAIEIQCWSSVHVKIRSEYYILHIFGF